MLQNLQVVFTKWFPKWNEKLADLTFHAPFHKYTVLIKMNISKESIIWLLMPKKDDQLLSINQLR